MVLIAGVACINRPFISYTAMRHICYGILCFHYQRCTATGRRIGCYELFSFLKNWDPLCRSLVQAVVDRNFSCININGSKTGRCRINDLPDPV